MGLALLGSMVKGIQTLGAVLNARGFMKSALSVECICSSPGPVGGPCIRCAYSSLEPRCFL